MHGGRPRDRPLLSSPFGALLGGCYDAAHGVAVRHELVWGDFFLALGLALVTGLVGPFAV
ncbi:hypothetical protein ABZ746_00650 [Streptomyces sp. NPDC020096]